MQICKVKYRFAIIGCGKIARRHAQQISRVGVLLAVCDIEPEKAEKFGEDFGAKSYTDASEMIENESDVDIVSICSPNGLHSVHTLLALKKGKHVLCEKPLCLSLEDAYEMRDTTISYHKKLFVVKQNRYNPPVKAVKELISSGKLGKITSFQINCFWNRPEAYYTTSNWKGTIKLDGGALFTQFSHFVDLLYWFLGDVQDVSAKTENIQHPYIETEDTGMALLKMNNGAIGTLNYTVNAFKQNMEGSITLFGEKGTVKIGGQYLNTLEYKQLLNEEALLIDNEVPTSSNDYGYYQGSMSNHDKVYDHLIASLDEKESGMADINDGMKTVEIINRIYDASRLSFH
jgi:predicted dehydrogenase